MTTNNLMAPIPEPAFKPLFSLHGLESGQYLYQRRAEDGTMMSKFVTAVDVRAAFIQREEDTGWMSPGVVRCGTNAKGPFYVYSAPAQKVEITLEGEEPVSVPMPRTVLIAANQTYYLFALKSERVYYDEPVYQVPVPNIHDHGLVCWGTNAAPKIDVEQARKAWEMFFSTPFNDHLIQGRSLAEIKDVRKTLRALAGKRTYPLDDLVGWTKPVGATIRTVFTKITEGRNVG